VKYRTRPAATKRKLCNRAFCQQIGPWWLKNSHLGRSVTASPSQFQISVKTSNTGPLKAFDPTQRWEIEQNPKFAASFPKNFFSSPRPCQFGDSRHNWQAEINPHR
jgi:hypothetical protein